MVGNAVSQSTEHRFRSVFHQAAHSAVVFIDDHHARRGTLTTELNEWAWRVKGDQRARLLAPNSPEDWTAISDVFVCAARARAEELLRRGGR